MTSSERIAFAIFVGIGNAGLMGAVSLGLGFHTIWPGLLIAFGFMATLFLLLP